MNKGLISVGLILFATQAEAHTGTGSAALLSAFWHPFTGLDHLTVLLATGCLAASSTAQHALKWALGFGAALLLGMVLGQQGYYVPMVEGAIICSVLALGVVCLGWLRTNHQALLPLLALSALLHGLAHGVLLSGETLGTTVAMMSAMMVGAMLLLLIGYRLTNNGLVHKANLQQWLGGAMLLIGGGLLLS